MIRDHELKKRIDAVLPTPLSDNEWSFLDTQGYLLDQRLGRIGITAIAAIVEQGRAAFANSMPASRRGRGGEVTPVRVTAISKLIAHRAKNDEGVLAFQGEVLGGVLLHPNEVQQWIRERAEVEGPHTVLLMVPLPPGEELRVSHVKGGAAVSPKKPLCISKDWPAVGTWVDEVSFQVLGERSRGMPVVRNGVLDRLRISVRH